MIEAKFRVAHITKEAHGGGSGCSWLADLTLVATPFGEKPGPIAHGTLSISTINPELAAMLDAGKVVTLKIEPT